MQRESMVMYRGFAESIKCYPVEEQLAALWAIIDYGLDGTEYEGGGLARAAYISAKPQIDANNKRYLNAKKGGAPKGNQNARKQPETTKKQPKNNQNQANVNVNDNDNANDKKVITPLQQAIDDFIEHRKQIKAPMTEQAKKLMFGENGKLNKLAAGRDDLKIKILNQSIENGWKGIFELKEKKRTAGFNNTTERDYDMDKLELMLLASN